MDSKKLGMEIIENVPFQIDPDDPTKFTIVEGGFNTLHGNLFTMNNLFVSYYEEEKDNFPDKERIDIIDEILDINDAAITYAMTFLDENYPGVSKLLTETSFEDSFIIFLTETATNINASQEIQQSANEIVCEMLRSGSNEMVGKILQHTLVSTLLAKGDQLYKNTVAGIAADTMAELIHSSDEDYMDNLLSAEKRLVDMLDKISKYEFDDEEVMHGCLVSTEELLKFVRYMISNNIRPTDEIVEGFFENHIDIEEDE